MLALILDATQETDQHLCQNASETDSECSSFKASVVGLSSAARIKFCKRQTCDYTPFTLHNRIKEQYNYLEEADHPFAEVSKATVPFEEIEYQNAAEKGTVEMRV